MSDSSVIFKVMLSFKLPIGFYLVSFTVTNCERKFVDQIVIGARRLLLKDYIISDRVIELVYVLRVLRFACRGVTWD